MPAPTGGMGGRKPPSAQAESTSTNEPHYNASSNNNNNHEASSPLQMKSTTTLADRAAAVAVATSPGGNSKSVSFAENNALDSSTGSLNASGSLQRVRGNELEDTDDPAPPEKKYKTVNVFHLNKWTRRFALIIFFSTLLATFVPQFVWYTEESHTFGLFQECKGMACLPANFTVLQQHPGCRAACNDIGVFRARFEAASGMLWVGVCCSLVLGMVQYLHFGRNYLVPLNGILIPTIVTTLVGVGVIIAALAIFGTTVSFGYEESTCDYKEGCLVAGTASYVAVFGFFAFLFSGVFGIVAGLFHRRRLGLKFEFFESALKHLPMEDIKMGTSMVNVEEQQEQQQQQQEKKDDENKIRMIHDEELTDIGKAGTQETAAFNSDSNSAAAASSERRGTKEYTEAEQEAMKQITAASALVAQESNFYATTHDGDLENTDNDNDEDSTDGDDDEDINSDEEERRKNMTDDEKKTLRAEMRRKRKQEKEDKLAESHGILKEAVGDLKVNVRSARGWQRLFNQLAIFCAVLAVGFLMGAVLSPKWVYLSPTAFSSALKRYSIGLLAQCNDNSCTLVDNDALLINNTCGNTEPQLRARLGISAIFYLASAIFAVPLYFSATKSCTSIQSVKTRIIMTTVTFFLTFFGVVLSMHTFDSWINCDIPWCEAFLSTHSEGSCEYGFMFGAALVAVSLSTILLMMNIIQRVCRPCGYEEKITSNDKNNKNSSSASGKYSFVNVSTVSRSDVRNSNNDDDDHDGDDLDLASPPPPKVESTPKESKNEVVG